MYYYVFIDIKRIIPFGNRMIIRKCVLDYISTLQMLFTVEIRHVPYRKHFRFDVALFLDSYTTTKQYLTKATFVYRATS